MAAPDCVFYRTLCRSRPGPNKWSSPAICREVLYVVELQRYSRDQGSSVYFPQAVLNGDDLYDATLTDGHCRLRVTLDPGLNPLVERYVLRSGSALCDAAFTPAMTAQLPACPMAPADRDSYKLLSVEVSGGAPGEDGGLRRFHVDSLSWFGSSGPAGALVPLRANRSVFLPLWNNVDYSGEAWREAPPAEEEEEEEDSERRPTVTVSELRDSFLIGHGGVARGVVHHQLIVRIINKSHLMYYGRKDLNCECPYKAVLEVCDRTGSVSVVLWNSVCLGWYRRLKPGDIIKLRRYRVKRRFQAQQDDIEISVNSRNPSALISVLPESSASPQHLPPATSYSFCNSKQLLDRPHGVVCDVIGLLTFSGRPERIRSDGGAALLEYHWLRLEDGSSNQPIMVKLFSTSQPEIHHKLHPRERPPPHTHAHTDIQFNEIHFVQPNASACLSLWLPVSLSLSLSRCLSLSLLLSLSLSGCLSLSLWLPVSLSGCLSLSLSLSGCLSLSLSLSGCLSLSLGACLSLSRCLSLSLSLVACLSLSRCLSLSLVACLSLSLPVSLSLVACLSLSGCLSLSHVSPVSVVVCTRLKLNRGADGSNVVFYLTNTTYTQVYCTGMRHHSQMSYRKLRPVRQFLQWLRNQDDRQVLSRALIGGFFIYPSPPVSLEMYMRDRRGVPGFLRGAELHRELERLRYRERRTFCMQAAVTMVTYSRRGAEERCLCWRDQASSLFSSSSPFASPSPSSPTTPRSVRSPPSSSSPSLSPTSLCSTSTPVDHRSGTSRKRRFTETLPHKRRPFVTLQSEHNKSVILFEASMEFLESTNADEDDKEDEDGDTSSFVTAPLPPDQPPIALETLPLRYDHAHREEHAVAMAMGGALSGRFDSVLDEYYTLRLRALSDGVLVDTLFLPLSSSSPSPPLLAHANTWTSILSHGSFCPHTPPPSPADLISAATQLANQRLVCVLEACHLGGATTELVLSRAFPLNH
uniref:RPA-related protein RADX-like n=1 Tax=Gasterosteus aculeatus aculeatus TaxID=481459 RepID=A0AAQ4S2L0_GASAC